MFGWTGLPSEAVAAAYPWICAGGLAAAAISAGDRLSLDPEPIVPLRAPALVLAVAAILLIAASADGLGRPLGWDELRAALQIPGEPLARVLSLHPAHADFFPSPNHGMANLTSWLSVAALGRSVEAFQLPAVGFTALTAGVLVWLGRRRLSAFAVLLVAGHLLVNAIARWHFISLRGYPSLMAFSWLAFALGWEAHDAGPRLDGRLRAVLVASLALLVWSHPFGILVSAAIVAALIPRCGARLWPVIGIAPLAAVIALREYGVLSEVRNVFVGGFSRDRFLDVMHAFGWGHFRWAKAGLSLAVLIAAGRTARQRVTYPWLFTVASVALFLIAMVGFQSSHVRGRFLLGFVGPIVAFVGEAVAREPSWRKRLAGGIASVALFVLGPALTFPTSSLVDLTLPNATWSASFQRAWEASGYANPECFDLVGDRKRKALAEDLFRPRRPFSAPCPRRFRLSFGEGANGVRLSEVTSESKSLSMPAPIKIHRIPPRSAKAQPATAPGFGETGLPGKSPPPGE